MYLGGCKHTHTWKESKWLNYILAAPTEDQELVDGALNNRM